MMESDQDDPDGPAQDAKKRKATGAAAHRVLKRIEGKRVRLSQRQLAEISIYANKHKTLSREDAIHWAVEKFSLTESPHVALISKLRKPEVFKKHEEFLSSVSSEYKLDAKSSRGALYEDIDSQLMMWITRCEHTQAILTDKLIQEKATALAIKLNHTKFKASDGWLEGFKKRHSIKQYKLHGESGSADKQYVEVSRVELPAILQGTDEDDLYNCDETALMYRKFPSHTLATQSRKGNKAMSNKDRLTILLCCNATGTHKIDPLVIGKAARPLCFGPKKGGWEPSDVHVSYTSNKTAWMNSKVFYEWMLSFNRQMRTKFGEGSTKKAWLLMDNSATHAYPQGSTAKMWGTGFRFRGFEMSHTRVLFLPPKTTSEIQPLDGGIIQSFKCQWRKFLLR